MLAHPSGQAFETLKIKAARQRQKAASSALLQTEKKRRLSKTRRLIFFFDLLTWLFRTVLSAQKEAQTKDCSIAHRHEAQRSTGLGKRKTHLRPVAEKLSVSCGARNAASRTSRCIGLKRQPRAALWVRGRQRLLHSSRYLRCVHAEADWKQLPSIRWRGKPEQVDPQDTT
eukprot:scaffold472_cov264-Pinguiococcus_pyrenoidosus.AAC.13